ncbi:helix-turn-helix transcriptional regulator [Mycobacterium sp.]|uniref:helix-turn-helix domain-containing protein n=1 Tax=Mycobacterium sp. TaxID=1785 RepID=UPI002BE4F9E8|nr:helix-turn-helix transcriptional regulator [Mycobacterium sp.]HTY35405.1 helix-turn-helix transcriptional regulator [Mycobacterium sp.]
MATPEVSGGTANPLRFRVAAEVRAWRARRQMTQAQLGRALGLSQPQMSAKLRGLQPISLDETERLAAMTAYRDRQVTPSREDAMRTPSLIAACLLLAGCGGASAAASTPPMPATFTVSGDLTVADVPAMDSSCFPSGGYADIEIGAQVTISDANGVTVALGQLQAGTPAASSLPSRTDCMFAFTVPGVPAGKGFYGIEVSHRGVIRYAEADITRPVRLKLG